MKQFLLAVVLSVLMIGSVSAAGAWYIMGNDFVHIPGQPNTEGVNYPPFAETLTLRGFGVEQDCLDALANHRKSKVFIRKSNSDGTYTNSSVVLKSERIENATCQLLP